MRKDTKLDILAEKGWNIAQFLSFDKDNLKEPKYLHIKGLNNLDRKMLDVETIIEKLIEKSSSNLVNVRSFSDEEAKGNRFVMGLDSVAEIIETIQENADEGRHSIINENIDIADGGVSGVILDGLMEFSPEDTPRCVEKEGVCSLPTDVGCAFLETVYGVKLPFADYPKNTRVEFSIHPEKQGLYQSHIIIWEYENINSTPVSKEHIFPNNFSKFIGDKAYGLTLAHILGIEIPRSFIISKRVPPFIIGEDTSTNDIWMRPAPRIKRAGLYDTHKGWRDPYKMMEDEESKTPEYPDDIGSIIVQKGVKHDFSGSALIGEKEEDTIIEGVEGRGDGFMVGDNCIDELPEELIRVLNAKINIWRTRYLDLLGRFSVEWVAESKEDSYKIWVVQLNQYKGSTKGDVIVPTKDEVEYVVFEAMDGIKALRTMVDTIKSGELGENVGVEVVGDVGVTSHIGDILRAGEIPSYINRK